MSNVWINLCRACLTAKESFTYFLFEDVSAETFSFCTSVEIHEDETLTRCLCEECYSLLIKYSEFKRTCIESQNTLLCCKTIKAEDIQPGAEIDRNEENITVNTVDYQTNVETKFEDIKQEELVNNFDEVLLTPDVLSDDSEHKTPKKKKKRKKTENGITAEEIQQQNYTCDICGKAFKYSKRLNTHRLGHFHVNVETNLQCLKCNKTFLTVSGLRRHDESVHARVRLASVSCARCGRVCANKHSLRAHQKMHSKNRAHAVCHVCGKRVSSAVILRAHLETHKADRERRHTCEHCGKKFFTNTILLSHIKRLHTGLRYICGVCDYPFTDKHNLSKHLLIHEGIKLYKCDICNKSYTTNGSLVEHKRIHSGERPFSCSFCSKSFLSKRRLIDHHRTHTGDKPHRCVVCEQRFTQRGTLKRHMKVHDPMKAPLQMTKRL